MKIFLEDKKYVWPEEMRYYMSATLSGHLIEVLKFWNLKKSAEIGLSIYHAIPYQNLDWIVSENQKTPFAGFKNAQ